MPQTQPNPEIQHRRIDDLGRVVIPKYLRGVMGIKEGDLLEMRFDGDKLIVTKVKEAADHD